MPVEFTPAEIGHKYDELAPLYDRFDVLAELSVLRRYRRSWFRRASGDVLEVATGTGRNLQYYPPDCRITAIDMSDGMLRVARKRARSIGRDVRFQRMNAQELQFPANSFDTVTSSLSTCTFPDPVAALREMARVCRPAGKILLFEHGRSSSGFVGRIQDQFADRHARQVGCHWNREPHELVQQAGLRIVRHDRSMLGMLHLIEAVPDDRVADRTASSGNVNDYVHD